MSRRVTYFSLLSLPVLALATAYFYPASSPEIIFLGADNGEIATSRHRFLYEQLRHPALRDLRAQENLDQVVSQARQDVERFALLREWVHAQWETLHRGGQPEPYPNAHSILKKIRAGELPGGMCSEHSAVLMQVSLALGHQARIVCLSSKEGSGHRVNEIWSDELNKWVLMDPYYNLHYTRDGTPLNAIELHQALVADDLDGIAPVPGESPEDTPPLRDLVSLYHDLTVVMRNNHLSHYDPEINRWSLGFVDAFTDGRPEFSRSTSTLEDDLYWSLNRTVIEIGEKNVKRGTVRLAFKTNTPGFRGYEFKTDESRDWSPIPKVVDWYLHGGDNVMTVRAVNELGVRGSPVSLAARYEP